jgi:hypothetical protein
LSRIFYINLSCFVLADRPDLLCLIKRKAHNKHELRAKQQQHQQRLNAMADEMSGGSSFPSITDGSVGGSDAGGSHSHESIFTMADMEQEQQKQKRIREDFEWR